MDDDERERLEAVIAASDEIVDADGGWADPVAQRRVMDALLRKAGALGKLGRYDGRIGVWDEMTRVFEDDPPPGRPLIVLQATAAKASDLLRLDRFAMALEVAKNVVDGCAEHDQTRAVRLLAVQALAIERDALAKMGREAEALGVDDQIVGRFFDAEEPELRRYVTRALSFRSRALWRANRVEDALEVSRLLVAWFERELEDSLPDISRIVVDDLFRLVRIGGPDLQGVAWFVFVAAVNSGSVALTRTIALLALPDLSSVLSTPSIERVISSMRSLARAAMPARLTRSRHRLAQALEESQAVIRRLDGAHDPQLQQLAGMAQITQGAALVALGHPRTGARTLQLLTSGDQPPKIQAWQQLAAMFARGPHRFGKVGAASALSLRADALAAGNPRIARIAYDDSMHDNAVTDRSILVKLIAWGLRPRPKGKRAR